MGERTKYIEMQFPELPELVETLYAEDSTFAEVCDDYTLLCEAEPSDPSVQGMVAESLEALREELRQHLSEKTEDGTEKCAAGPGNENNPTEGT